MRACEGQMALDLFPAADRDWRAEQWEWLSGRPHRVPDSLRPAFDRIWDERPQRDAFEASKCLRRLGGTFQLDGWGADDAEALGLFDPEVPYHVCWDRCWAAARGLAKGDAMRVSRWDYSTDKPIYEGN